MEDFELHQASRPRFAGKPSNGNGGNSLVFCWVFSGFPRVFWFIEHLKAAWFLVFWFFLGISMVFVWLFVEFSTKMRNFIGS